jgi:hypothetical protein
MYPMPPEPIPTSKEIRYRELHGKYPPSYTKKYNAYMDEVADRNRVYARLDLRGSGNTCVGAMCDDGLPKLNPETGMPMTRKPKPRNMSAAEMRQVITRNPIAPKPPKYRPPEKSTWKSRSRGYHSEYRGGSRCPICGENVMDGGTRWLFPNMIIKTDDEMAKYRKELEEMPETEERSKLYHDLWEADKNPIPDVIQIASPTKPISVNKYIGILLQKGVGMREAEKIALEEQKRNPKYFFYPKPKP